MKSMNYLVLGVAALVLGASVALPTTVSATSPHANVPGNNGTLKVHEKNTPVATESNDPKVCEFNFEGFGFDQHQSGIVVITTQGGGSDKTEVKRVDLPAANASGYMESLYVTLPNGHYKTTAYGKDVHGVINYDFELKAKSKVIKVDCPPVVVPPVTVVTPVTPTNPTTPTTPVTGVAGTSTGTGHVLAEAASTVKGKGASAPLPESVAATGTNLLQSLFNMLFLGLGAYSAMLFRRT